MGQVDRHAKSQARHVAFDLAASLALELAVAEAIRKLRGQHAGHDGDGDTPEKRRLVRRLLAAVLVEFAEGGIAEARWQRRRLQAAIERAAARESVAHAGRHHPADLRVAAAGGGVSRPDSRDDAKITADDGDRTFHAQVLGS